MGNKVSDYTSLIIEACQELRAELKDIERAENPDIRDAHGRLWVWKDKDLYTHCGMATRKDWVAGSGLPTQSALDNPNYNLCGLCVGGRERNVKVCKPEWNCSHSYCAIN